MLALKAPGNFVPANDNEWDGRRLLAWPTAKRLIADGRKEDLALLWSYRALVDTAFGEPANDNCRDPAPDLSEGGTDDRAAFEIIVEVDRLPPDFLPTIEEMQEATGVEPGRQWPAMPRPVIVEVDQKTGAVRRELGGLAFIHGSRLLEYRTTPDAKKWKRPATVHAHHKSKKKRPTPSLVPNSSDTWGLEDQIVAREELRTIYDVIPASSVRLLEIACGPTRAREIGEAFGKREKTAERLGVRLIDRAIGHLREHWRPQIADKSRKSMGLFPLPLLTRLRPGFSLPPQPQL
ncbi:hypothetical protein N8A98_05155 [Devosia neptuniae]|uniref:Uncharacterized protein n=1 Tax=Devosia neptuniae TaxID=191302 RepID=A0ABY6CFJ4_9HYPH|nr:hypothetical protein [Devosia neptuniae]UXN70583.1 hypothetical protein N8A98_05155 [Devosia neptuniae]